MTLWTVRPALANRLHRLKNTLLYRRFKAFTMVPEEEFINNLLLAERVKHLPGCIVECGVWRGGMSAGIAALLGPTRKYYLFDSFQGLPQAKEIDGPAAIKWQQSKESSEYYDNCSAAPEFAMKAMVAAGASDFELVPGWFEQTAPAHRVGAPIALLRLDADWYDSTIVCLENLFDRVVPGGMVILDDYHAWDGCSRAVHDFLSRRRGTERIRSLGESCYLTKTAGPVPET